jgi:hypothetical protein
VDASAEAGRDCDAAASPHGALAGGHGGIRLQQQQLAPIAGVSGAMISNCESGKAYPQTATRRALRSTLKDLGVTCTFDGKLK